MSTIDTVKLYPFSPLKLLHETRKLTAVQAKFFVALMCLYFERAGELWWRDGDQDMLADAYAPYCGVTKKTFIKMLDKLEWAGVLYINDDGCLTPIIAEEIQQAMKEGTRIINMTGDYEAVTPEASVVAHISQEEKEGMAVAAEARFQGAGEYGGDGRGGDYVRDASGEGDVAKENDRGHDPLNVDWEANGMSLEERREEITQKIEFIRQKVTELVNRKIQYEDFRPLVIAKRTLFETRQLVRDDPRLMDLLIPLLKSRDFEHEKFYGDEFIETWETPEVWERLPSVLYGDEVI